MTDPTDPEPEVDPTRAIDHWYMASPDGRYVYAAVSTAKGHIYPSSPSTWVGNDVEGNDVDLDVQVGSSSKAERIIADRPLVSLTRFGAQPMVDGAITLRDLSMASDAAPPSIDRERYDALPNGYDECSTFPTKEHYAVERLPDPDNGPPAWFHDLANLRPVPLEWEDPPAIPEGLRWEASPAFLVLWGPVAAPHLLPGALHGLQSQILQTVAAHPWVRPFINISSGDRKPLLLDQGRKVSFYFDRRIEGDPTVTKQVKPSPRSRKTVPQTRPVYRTERIECAPPPDAFAAPNLAAALARLDSFVADKVAELLPAEGRTCGRCNGVGIVIGDQPATVSP